MRIGSYQVLLELARGGMGKVYLARSVGPGGVERLVAIKRAHEHLLVASGAAAERFLDEARIAAHVHHSNVIGVHQAGADDDGYYLVLDYVEGESLQGLLEAATARGTRVAPQIVLAVVGDALAGLHAAHEATDGQGRGLGILHRDVSTQNLLVGRDGVTRLTDFGIAKSALSLAVTDEHYVQGKLVYMPPEYLQRRPVDRTLDVYAMGMTLWIGLAGEDPWAGAEEAQLLQSILVQGVPPLSRGAPHAGPEIAAVVDRACRRDPRERFPTARAMLDALEAASRAIGGVARHVEVAEVVEGLVGAELAARRELVKRRRSEPEVDAPEPALPEPTATRARPDVTLPRERPDGWAPDEPRVPTEALRRTWEEPKPWRALVYVAIVAVVLVIGIAAMRRGSSRAGATGESGDAPAVPARSSIEAEPAHAAEAPSERAPPPEAPTVVTGTPSAAPAPSAVDVRAPRGAHRPPKRVEAAPALPYSTANPYR